MATLDDRLFSPDRKLEPYWWYRAPRLPATVDLLVVGAGYTGVNAADDGARRPLDAPQTAARYCLSPRSAEEAAYEGMLAGIAV